MPEMQKSIWGRKLGISTTGGIISAVGATGRDSTDFDMTAQMWGVGMIATVTSTIASTLTNYGLVSLTSGSATAITGFDVAAPVAGLMKEIHIATSASEISFNGTSTAILFGPTAEGGGSTLFLSAANLAGTTIILRGLSATQWAVIGDRTTVTVG